MVLTILRIVINLLLALLAAAILYFFTYLLVHAYLVDK